MKKVLVIGGLGYIGRYLKEELQRAGYDQYYFDNRRPEWAAPGTPGEARFLEGDRNNPADLAKIRANHYDAVIDLIAYHPRQTAQAVEALDGYTGRYVHLGTFSAYDVPAVSPFTEEQPLRSSGDDSYGGRKAACENVLREYGEKRNFPYVIVRSAPIMGPNDQVSRENYYIKRILTKTPVILPNRGLTQVICVYVKDLVRAVVSAAGNKNARGRAFHVAQREQVGLRAHVEEIARCLRATEAGKDTPPPQYLYAGTDELISAGFNLSAFPYYTDGTFYPDISAAIDTLGYEPTPYGEALKTTVEWFAANDAQRRPAWPGRGSTQARLAATNETLHYLREKQFIKGYRRLKRKLYKELNQPVQASRELGENRDMLDISTAIFTGRAPAAKKNIVKVLVPTGIFDDYSRSRLARSLEPAKTQVCLVPDDLVEYLTGGQTEGGQYRQAEGKDNPFPSVSYLEPVPNEDPASLDRQYLLYVNNPDSGDGTGLHYSHEEKFRRLEFTTDDNQERNTEKEKNGAADTVILRTGGAAKEARLLERVESRKNREETTDRQYVAGCRIAAGPCEARRLTTLIVDGDGNLGICFPGPKQGSLDDDRAAIAAGVEKRIAAVEKERGCKECPQYGVCPGCLFVTDHREYCRVMRANPDFYKYEARNELLTRLAVYEPAIANGTEITVKQSTMDRRLFLPYIEHARENGRGNGRENAPTASFFPNKRVLLAAVAGNKSSGYYAYRMDEGTAVKLDLTDALVLEAVQDGSREPGKLAGKMFRYENHGPLGADDIGQAIERLVQWKLIETA